MMLCIVMKVQCSINILALPLLCIVMKDNAVKCSICASTVHQQCINSTGLVQFWCTSAAWEGRRTENSLGDANILGLICASLP